MKVFESVKELRAELDKAEQQVVKLMKGPGGKTAPSW